MKALSIQQPWAWAILTGRKRVENRTWLTHYRGPLLIHAGNSRKWYRALTGKTFPDGTPLPQESDVHFGAILGVVQLQTCVVLDDPAGLTLEQAALRADPFASGPVCWVLAEPRSFGRPIPYKGQVTLFDVRDDVLAAMVEEVSATGCDVQTSVPPTRRRKRV
jgi:hypothetical protein